MSKSELDELMSGIDFNDDFDDEIMTASPPPPNHPSPVSSSLPSFGPITQLESSRPLLPLLFSSRKPALSSVQWNKLDRARFATSSRSPRDTSASNALPDLVAPAEDHGMIESLSEQIDDKLAPDSSFEIVKPARKSRSKVAMKENEPPRKGRKVIEIDDEEGGSDVEIVVVPKKRSPPARTKPVNTPVSSGWFTKLDPIPLASTSTTTAAAPVASTATKKKVTKPSSVTKRSKPALSPYEIEKARLKANKIAQLAALPAFSYATWSTNSPKLIFTTDEVITSSTIRGMIERGSTVFGFDLEWEPANRRGVENKTALVQICDDHVILLVQVSKMNVFSPSIKKFLNHPKLYKCGVMVSGDGKKLYRDHRILPQGLIELNTIVKEFDSARWLGRVGLIGLQDQVGAYLDRYLDKDSSVRMGKWGESLAIAQQLYAANDVYSSLQVFNALSSLCPTIIDLDRISTCITATGSMSRSASDLALSVSTRGSSTTSVPRITKPNLPPTARQLEAFHHFVHSQLSPSDVSTLMSIPPRKSILPLSTVWNLLGAVDRDASLKIDDCRLLDLVQEVHGASKSKMLDEFAALLGEVEAREAVRLQGD